MMAKGTYASIVLATDDLDGTFERVEASGAEVVQEPIDQPYGVRDCAFRDPAGNHIRINAAPEPSGDGSSGLGVLSGPTIPPGRSDPRPQE